MIPLRIKQERSKVIEPVRNIRSTLELKLESADDDERQEINFILRRLPK